MNTLSLAPSASASHSLPVAADTAWVSMRHLQRAMVFMRARGWPAEQMLQDAGLSHDQLADGDGTVPLNCVEAILAMAQQHHGDPLLGLHMADDIQPGTLGALGFVLQACSTMGDLLDVTVRFNGLMSNIGRTSVVHRPGMVEVRWECLAGSPLLRRHAGQYIVGTFVSLARILAPGVQEAVSVQFAHSRPDQTEQVRAYFDFFKCAVYFDRPCNAVTVPTAFLQLRLPHGDALLKDLLESHARQLLNRRARIASIAEDVQRLLHALILTGVPSKEAVALQLGTSTRSLHRRLEEAGTSYGEQLDAVRLTLARQHLDAGDAPTADIADRLGFSSPQSFMRWFRQQLGMTPHQYRHPRAGSCPLDAPT